MRTCVTALVCLTCAQSIGCHVYDDSRLGAPVASVNVTTAGTGAQTAAEMLGHVAGTNAGAGGRGAIKTTSPANENATCEPGGECWWWTTTNEGCRSDTAPTLDARPESMSASAPLSPDSVPEFDPENPPDFYLGWTSLRFSAAVQQSDNTSMPQAAFGLDLDGLCTNSSSCSGVLDVPCRSRSKEIPYDGDGCRDNAFANLVAVANMLPMLTERYGLYEDSLNCGLKRGSYNMLIRVRGYNRQADDPEVRVDWYTSPGLEKLPSWTCQDTDFRTAPPWRFSALWKASASELANSDALPDGLPDSMISDMHAYVRHGYLVARLPDDAAVRLAGDGNPYRGLHLPMRSAVWMGRLTLAQDNLWRIEDGLVAGRTPIEQVKRSLHEVGICPGAKLDMFYDWLMTYADENADLLASGQNDANAVCDAMSVGIAFTASQVSVGAPGPIEPLVMCCSSGTAVEDCEAECGDGKVSGAEECDTAIPDGKPGACPKSCDQPDQDHCQRAYLQGMGCLAHCVYERINAFVKNDGCCPPGATAAQDSDCTRSLLCGNGIVEVGETCDQDGCGVCPTVNNACLKPDPSGSKDQCTLACGYKATSECKSGDRCCPKGCKHDTDSDCPSACGDGKIDSEAGETCEAGTNKTCEAAAKCDDKNACTEDIVTGAPETCNVVCSHWPKDKPVDNDKCCNPDIHANANIDNDCVPFCGNGVIEKGEECDDGNKNPADDCSNECKTVNQLQRCIDAVGLNDECTKCICTKCLDETNQCYNTPSTEQNMLCLKLARCFRTSKCTGTDCYCAQDLLNCEANPKGPCKDEVEAAAGSAVLSTIAVRSQDPQYVIGRVNVVGQCGWNRCPTECQ